MNTFRKRPTREKSTVKDIAILSAILSKALFNSVFGSPGIYKHSEAYDLIADLSIDIFQAIEQEQFHVHNEQPDEMAITLIVTHAKKLLTEKYKINPLNLK